MRPSQDALKKWEPVSRHGDSRQGLCHCSDDSESALSIKGIAAVSELSAIKPEGRRNLTRQSNVLVYGNFCRSSLTTPQPQSSARGRVVKRRGFVDIRRSTAASFNATHAAAST
jgi:hypothetical protein